jgi:heterodisulfide reductase subunit B
VDERLNSEGLRRDQLTWALTQARIVRGARKINSCLLCRDRGVNEAGLCNVCYTLLNDAEHRLANRWMSGEGP